jgi:glycerophosphoryl diester phosphodiesterase
MPAPTHPLLVADRRRVVGHRGNRAHAPENTLPSFREAVALGVDAVELDVRLTADGEVVVMHDPTVDRTTDGTGAVAALTWAQLARLDAGHRFSVDGGRTTPWRGRDAHVPRFADVLAALPDTYFLIEIKVPEAAAPLRRVIEAAGASARCIVESFHHAAGAAFAGSTIGVGASQRQVAALLPRALARVPSPHVPFRFMAIPPTHGILPLPVAGFVAATRAAGAPVHVWTINAPAQAERLGRVGVTGIISDDPAVMLPLRDRRP